MKRALLFVLLLAIGFLVLVLSLDDNGRKQRAQQPTQDAAQPEPKREPATDAIRLDQEGTQVGLSGAFTINRHRDVPREGGGVVRQKIYELTCKDSAPAADGRHRLQDLRVRFFDDGKHAADLTASRALVELEAGANKQRELRENRELELEDALLVSVPGGDLPPVRLELGLVRALVDEAAISLHTADENQPVTVIVDGARSGELRGRGMRARFPRERNRDDSALELVIQKEPIVQMQGLLLKASGTLRYVEMLRSGAASIALDRDVSADLEPQQGAKNPVGGALVVTGQRMLGWLQRSQKQRGSASGRGAALSWTALRLFGEPAHVHTDTIDLDSPRITVEPGPSGELATITADGGDSSLQQRGDQSASFRSAHPIRLHRASASIAAVHRAFGIPSFALGALAQMEIVVFEGAAQVDAQDGVELRTDRGMHVFRPQSQGDAAALAARAFGEVRIAYGKGQDRVEASGNSGFLLARSMRGDDLRMGKDDAASPQRFQVTRGALRLSGTGAARVVRAIDGKVSISLRSATPSIEAENGARDTSAFGTLKNANSLDATIADSLLVAFTAEGTPADLETKQGGQPLFAKALRIEQISDAEWRLLGKREQLATLRYGSDVAEKGSIRGDLLAPRIDIHRVTERSVVLDARGEAGEPARLDADAPMRSGSDASHVAVRANRIRAMPFSAGPDALLRRMMPFASTTFPIVAGPLAQPWITADGDVIADIQEDPQNRLHVEAHSLLARPGSRSMQIEGNADALRLAKLVRFEQGVESLVAEGARIRFFDDGGEHVSMLTTWSGRSAIAPPRVWFRSASSSVGWLRGECQGEIEVVREAVRFFGPVQATGMKNDGTEDPLGMRVDARELTMRRHKDTGELLAVDAGGGVTVRWRDLYAHSKKVELDLRWQRCIAEDADGAEVRFGNGQSYNAQRIEANYATYTVRSYFGRLQQDQGSEPK